MRLVTSPHLTSEDTEQIAQGYAEREAIAAVRAMEALRELSAEDDNAYTRLAWLVANNAIDIRLALPNRNTGVRGIYHEKIGIFRDENDAVAFTGSLNESFAALEGNIENIDVFTSWSEPARVNEKTTYFERLWSGQTPQVEILDFPEALKRQLISEAPSEYPEETPNSSSRPATAAKVLKEHQLDALAAWGQNAHRGILEMATGSGKTFVALNGMRQMIEQKQISTGLILVPYIAIADQWRQEIEEVLGLEVIVCHSQSGDWRARLKTALALARFREAPTVIVALYDTASTSEFREIARSQLKEPALLVADEVHNITIDSADDLLLETYQYRLGLSATPERYLDDPGTSRLTAYFDGIVFRYSLAQAIADDVLTPYDYHPVVCGPDDEGGPWLFTGVNSAKLNKFTQIFENTTAASEGYALIYCQPQQLDDTKEWLGVTMRKPIHTFTAQEDLPERREILREFGSGHLYALVAMRCLDEGVDVPPTRSAFLLGSSENPKQFVQRRGRVLRKYPRKTSATIYDFIYLPRPETARRETEIRKELTRFAEFALAARNSRDAFDEIVRVAEARGIPLAQYATAPV